jgi:6-phosphogluconate dehydrogenase
MIGLGRMGGNMVRRLIRGGHQCVVFDRSAEAVKELVKEKAEGAGTLRDFVQKLAKPRAIWLMVRLGWWMHPLLICNLCWNLATL